jgi:aminoglycoside phosphotransferase (APT) family kinase protein
MSSVIGAKIAEGREAEVYEYNGHAGTVLKLYRPGYGGHVAESAALTRLGDGQIAPRLIDALEIDGRHGLILERLHGSDMLAMLQRQPWRLSHFAVALAEAQIRIHSIQAPSDLPDARESLATRIDAVGLRQELLDFVRWTLDGLPSGDRLLHGDLHPGNVLVGADRVSVIDWANATRGVAGADFARTMLLLQTADPLPGTPLLFRGLMAVGRSMFAGTFSRVYRQRCSDGLKDVDLWAIVSVAARIAEGIKVEEPRLVAFLETSRMKASR